jgi:hypothetical protein
MILKSPQVQLRKKQWQIRTLPRQIKSLCLPVSVSMSLFIPKRARTGKRTPKYRVVHLPNCLNSDLLAKPSGSSDKAGLAFRPNRQRIEDRGQGNRGQRDRTQPGRDRDARIDPDQGGLPCSPAEAVLERLTGSCPRASGQQRSCDRPHRWRS